LDKAGNIRLKVCGMAEQKNLEDLVSLHPDFIGFIFFAKSPRYVIDKLDPELFGVVPDAIKKVGVFVNEEFEKVVEYVESFGLNMVQLHGTESPEYCQRLNKFASVIKAFAVSKSFDFSQLVPYEGKADFFLFDTKTEKHGGSGQKFNWDLLDNYASETPFFLSGGIGEDDIPEILSRNFKGCYAIDINSKVEVSPGLKDMNLIKKIKDKLDRKVSL